jgi:hypothetical protein
VWLRSYERRARSGAQQETPAVAVALLAGGDGFGTQVLANDLKRLELAGQARDSEAVCDVHDFIKSRRIGCSRYRGHFRCPLVNLNNLIGTNSFYYLDA